MTMLAVLVALVVGTFISEDLTCITTGQLIASGEMNPFVGVFGCFAGIYLGDLGLWLVGRLVGQRVTRWPVISKRLPQRRLERLGEWFDRNAGKAIILSRFLPGTRLPLYVAAGTLGRCGGRFAFWTFVAAAVWTPALILLATALGESFTSPFARLFGNVGGVLAGAIAVFLIVRGLTVAMSRQRRVRLLATLSRLWRWEFWPGWLFYLPVAVWVALLSIRRGGFRGFSSITAANPGIPDGGFVGESKYQILSSLCPCHVACTQLIDMGPLHDRLNRFDIAVTQQGLRFPLILKPDVGQRGTGVRLARSRDDVCAYFSQHLDVVLVQAFHPGPYEAGVFYYRIPGELSGRIFSITDKVFPQITGDGERTLQQLVWDHPRYRMQARTFLARHADDVDRVLTAGERFRLAVAGNHCQGALFRDGAHLITPELERKFDAIARSFPDFYFGRFDVRYSDVKLFQCGEGFTIIELNGVTSESTNLYDPSWSLIRAYRTLFRQWSILFRIADESIALGNAPTPPMTLFRNILAYYRHRQQPVISD